MPKLVWRVKLVAELQPEVTTETEVARIERDTDANLAEVGTPAAGPSHRRRKKPQTTLSPAPTAT